MFMRYLGGGIGHHTVAMDTASKEIPVIEDDPASDSEMNPSENWNRENMSKYEFIGIKRCRSEDFQCESEKAMRLQRTSDNF